jgi:hypothetical protein
MKDTLTETEIRAELNKFLGGKSSLSNFYRWFVSETWDIEKRGDITARQFVYDIALRFAEYTSGHWNQEQLKTLLAQLSATYTLSFFDIGLPYVISGIKDRTAETSFTTSRFLSWKEKLANQSTGTHARPQAVSL